MKSEKWILFQAYSIIIQIQKQGTMYYISFLEYRLVQMVSRDFT